MRKKNLRTPKNYDGTQITTHKVNEILPLVLSQISDVFGERPDLVLAAWPETIGPKFSSMTQALSFVDGVLTVKVINNSSLYTLLSRHEKFRILDVLRQKFPKANIRNIVFRIA